MRRNTALSSVCAAADLFCQTLDTMVVGSKPELPRICGDFPRRGLAGTAMDLGA